MQFTNTCRCSNSDAFSRKAAVKTVRAQLLELDLSAFLYPMIAQNNTPKTAVLICNTGSPAAPTKEAVAKYLEEFLGDRRVVEMNPLIWQPILRGIIIPRRAQASADRYKTVWTQKGLLWWR